MSRIGVNALYLIPGAVGGTEIYLRELLAALSRVDHENEYFVFRNLETDAGLVPLGVNFHDQPQRVRARFRPARILWEQTVLPLEAQRHKLDVLLNPGYTAPLVSSCACVTVFHDLQHRRHPENFRWYDLPFWNLLLWASARRSRRLIAVSDATRMDLSQCYPFAAGRVSVALPWRQSHVLPLGPLANRTVRVVRLHFASAQESRSADPRLSAIRPSGPLGACRHARLRRPAA